MNENLSVWRLPCEKCGHINEMFVMRTTEWRGKRIFNSCFSIIDEWSANKKNSAKKFDYGAVLNVWGVRWWNAALKRYDRIKAVSTKFSTRWTNTSEINTREVQSCLNISKMVATNDRSLIAVGTIREANTKSRNFISTAGCPLHGRYWKMFLKIFLHHVCNRDGREQANKPAPDTISQCILAWRSKFCTFEITWALKQVWKAKVCCA